MIKLGEYNRLTVVKIVDFGLYLDGGEYWGEILLPRESAPVEAKEGDELEVFIYFDSEDRIIATMNTPKAVVGDFKVMEVVGVAKVGAFLDWGLRKDLLVPFREQREKLEVGGKCLVHVYVDETTDRIVASTKWYKFLNREPATYIPGEEVELIIGRKTNLGYTVIVNKKYEAVIYRDEIFRPLEIGETVTGYIKAIREDGKIDCILQRNDGVQEIDRLSRKILELLEQEGGFLRLTDKTDPGIIYQLLGCSKKNFKKSIGGLFKKQLIEIEENGIRLIGD